MATTGDGIHYVMASATVVVLVGRHLLAVERRAEARSEVDGEGLALKGVP